jgi:putative peptidoglycan lipid II flippase
MDGRAIASSYLRIAIASALAAGIAFLVWYGIDAALGRSLGAQLVSVGSGLLAGVASFLGLAWLLRVHELQTLLSLRRRSARTDGE